MSKAEILAELPNLTAEDREEILDRLWHLEEEQAIRIGPTASEKTLLDHELEEYEANPDVGAPWSEVECAAPDPRSNARRLPSLAQSRESPLR